MGDFVRFDFSVLPDLLTLGGVFGLIVGMLCVLLFALVYIFKALINKA